LGASGCVLPIFNDPGSPYYHPFVTALVATRSRLYATTGLTTLAMTGYIGL
jgi:hypothetical protein